MGTIGTIVLIIGWILMIVGWIMLLIVAFKKNIWWGLGTLFIPFVGLIFVILNWQPSKKAFFIWLLGFVVCIVGGLLGGSAGF